MAESDVVPYPNALDVVDGMIILELLAVDPLVRLKKEEDI